MKNLIIIAFLTLPTSLAFGQAQQDLLQVAKVENQKIFFTIDTIVFKNSVKRKIIANPEEVIFHKIQILKQPIIGKLNDSIFFIKMSSTNKKVTLSRAVTKTGPFFYLDNRMDQSSTFKLIYLMCQYKENLIEPCDPNIIEIDGKLNWICGTDPRCAAPGTELKCKGSISIILPE